MATMKRFKDFVKEENHIAYVGSKPWLAYQKRKTPGEKKKTPSMLPNFEKNK
jgi:hypothetical protein